MSSEVAQTPDAPDAASLLSQIDALRRELHGSAGLVPASLDSSLDRDLGLDSLTRMELLARLERHHGVTVSDRIAADAETPRDLLIGMLAETGVAAETLPSAASWTPPAQDAVAAPPGARTLLDVIRWHAEVHPQREHVRLIDETGMAQPLTYIDLFEGAAEVAAGLRERGLGPGQAVALMLPTELGYFHAFIGVLLAGGVPVPIYPPARLSQIEDHFQRHARILSNARTAWLITFDQARAVTRLLAARVEGLRGVTTVAELRESAAGLGGRDPGPDDVAFLQYTSGSTGNPKGVVLTHDNVLSSLRCMADGLGVRPDDVFVSWLPLYHDMGLIGAWLGSLYYGMPLVLMSPLSFLARPGRWLRAIHEHRGTLSGGPNFAYELCLRRVDEAELADLDLGCWRVAFNGAEPVSADTMERFADRFAGCGLRRSALTPVYGLAEATLGVAFTPVGRGPRYERVRREPLARDGRAEPADPTDPDALVMVSSGVAIPGFEVRAVDESGREAPERVTGRLEFKGPSTTAGYFRNPEATAELIHGQWLDSGDLAYVAEGEVYITGRSKDVIIRAGRNIYPYELELAIGDVDGVRRGCVAVFGAGDAGSGTERLVAVVETRSRDEAAWSRIRASVEALCVDLLDTPVDEVVLAPAHTVLKTSSGKIRRSAMRGLYEAGTLAAGGRSVWSQFLRMTGFAALAEARRLRRRLAALGFAAWSWACFVPLVALGWIGVVLVPGSGVRWAVARGAARTALALTRTPLAVTGQEHLPARGPCVLVVNHSSYLDGLVLVASLRTPVSFVAKRELAANPVARLFLEALGCRFVDRFDPSRSSADFRELTDALAAGAILCVFPEGTLHRMPGLLPFQLGAFQAAVEAAVPVVPVTLRGTRSMLRGNSLFPRPGYLRLTLDPPIEPEGGVESSAVWEAAVQLRDTVRARILARCGEPDLANRRPLLDMAAHARKAADSEDSRT